MCWFLASSFDLNGAFPWSIYSPILMHVKYHRHFNHIAEHEFMVIVYQNILPHKKLNDLALQRKHCAQS